MRWEWEGYMTKNEGSDILLPTFIPNLSLLGLYQTEFVPTLAAFIFCASVFTLFGPYLPTHFFFNETLKDKKAPHNNILESAQMQ